MDQTPREAIIEVQPEDVVNNYKDTDIAIIGMAGRFAGANNVNEFWKNLEESKDMVTEIPKDHWDYQPWFDENKEASNKTYSKWGSFVSDVDKFDPLFFGISPREAEWQDPQSRFLVH